MSKIFKIGEMLIPERHLQHISRDGRSVKFLFSEMSYDLEYLAKSEDDAKTFLNLIMKSLNSDKKVINVESIFSKLNTVWED